MLGNYLDDTAVEPHKVLEAPDNQLFDSVGLVSTLLAQILLIHAVCNVGQIAVDKIYVL